MAKRSGNPVVLTKIHAEEKQTGETRQPLVREIGKLLKRPLLIYVTSLQQLAHYDAREIEEHKTAQQLAEDIVVRCLRSGMMRGESVPAIKRKMKLFLTPQKTKSHGRPILEKDARDCGLEIELHDYSEPLWKACKELHVRVDNYVVSHASKCVENERQSFFAQAIR